MKIRELAQAFSALSSEDRLRIVGLLLREGQPNCGEIAQALGLSAPAVSYHLRAMEAAGLIERSRRGRARCVALTSRLASLLRSEVLCALGGKEVRHG
ncbi:MAG: ArsR/SmtB family transcription factor [Candidatus Bipolaricaulaceae bacterium]